MKHLKNFKYFNNKTTIDKTLRTINSFGWGNISPLYIDLFNKDCEDFDTYENYIDNLNDFLSKKEEEQKKIDNTLTIKNSLKYHKLPIGLELTLNKLEIKDEKNLKYLGVDVSPIYYEMFKLYTKKYKNVSKYDIFLEILNELEENEFDNNHLRKINISTLWLSNIKTPINLYITISEDIENIFLKINDLLINNNNNNIIVEKSINNDIYSNIKKWKNAKDYKTILKNCKELISKIKNDLKDINFNNIKYTNDDNIIEIYYNSEIIKLLNELLLITKSNKDISSDLFNDTFYSSTLEIEIDDSIDVNRIDIINELPNFLRGIGLGKKIYKKLIKDLNFLSSLSGYQPSINSNMVWSSILDDKEIYSFLNGDNIISFYHTYSYKKICDKLKTFYEYKNSKIILDDDFCIRYNIQDRDKFIKDNI